MSPFVSDTCSIPAFQPHPAFPLKGEGVHGPEHKRRHLRGRVGLAIIKRVVSGAWFGPDCVIPLTLPPLIIQGLVFLFKTTGLGHGRNNATSKASSQSRCP